MLLLAGATSIAACDLVSLGTIDTCEGVNRPDAPMTLRMLNAYMQSCDVHTSGAGCTDVMCTAQPDGGAGCERWEGRVRGTTAGTQCEAAFRCPNGSARTFLFVEQSCGPLAMDIAFDSLDASDARYTGDFEETDGGTLVKKDRK
jgi:hypothetical protein